MHWRVWIFGATVAVVVVVAAATVQTVPVSPSTPSQRTPTQAKANVQQKNRRVRRENAEDEEHVCRRHFGEWMHRHKRVYRDGQDMSRRYAVYRAHWKYIRDWNTRKDAHDKTIAHLTFRLGQNQFCDHSVEEFKQRMGYRPANYHKGKSGPAKTLRSTSQTTTNKPGRGVNAPLRFSSIYQSEGEPAARSFPASGNWADDKTVVGPIRMQGACGSCWSLATATVVESASAILTGEFVANSAQHLLDCCSGEDWWPNEGCNGGNMMTAYRCAAQKGVCEWDDYPYTGVAGTCRACYPVAWISGARLIGSNGDESPIAAAIAGGGPVVVAITASIPTFQFYASGVYNDVSCPSTFDTLDHAVVLTGYGIEAPSQPYWWLRNTWGVEWGEQGYMRLQRGTNLCGVASEVTQPIAKRSDDPSANALRRQMAQKALRATIQNDPSQSAAPSEELDFGANQPEYVEAAPR